MVLEIIRIVKQRHYQETLTLQIWRHNLNPQLTVTLHLAGPYPFTVVLKTHILLFKKHLNQTKVVNENTEGISRALYKLQVYHANAYSSPTSCFVIKKNMEQSQNKKNLKNIIIKWKLLRKLKKENMRQIYFREQIYFGITIVLLLWDNVSSLKRLNNKLLLKIISSSHHQSKLYE